MLDRRDHVLAVLDVWPVKPDAKTCLRQPLGQSRDLRLVNAAVRQKHVPFKRAVMWPLP